jgi:hypothetical protein
MAWAHLLVLGDPVTLLPEVQKWTFSKMFCFVVVVSAMLSQGCHKATWISQTWLFALCRQLYPSYKVRIGCSDTPSSPRHLFKNVHRISWVFWVRISFLAEIFHKIPCLTVWSIKTMYHVLYTDFATSCIFVSTATRLCPKHYLYLHFLQR